MTLPVKFHPLAELEAAAFVRSYTTISEQLGTECAIALRKQFLLAADHPLIGPKYYKDFRKLSELRFKLLVLYNVLPDAIGVGAIVDARMDPRRIRRILRGR